MTNLLKKITLDGTELEICDDTARTASTTNANNITTLTSRVDDISTTKGVNVTYDGANSALVITHN